MGEPVCSPIHEGRTHRFAPTIPITNYNVVNSSSPSDFASATPPLRPKGWE
ncbi:MAG: hypothetical protein LBS50_07340 [Prevotellaceae bacterium]|nr:hypothetical protein [Prevotellaceae bacterium]